MVVDVNPQFLNISIFETAINTFSQGSFSTPVVQLGGRSMVMEILKIFLKMDMADPEAAQSNSHTCEITKKSQTALGGHTSSNTILQQVKAFKSVTGAAGEVVQPDIQVEVFDFTDGQGNGILHAGSKIFISNKGVGNAAVKTASAKILYRLKSVSANELVGLLTEESG